MHNLLEKAPLSLKVLGHIVLGRGEYLFDSNINAKIRSYKGSVTSRGILARIRTLVHIPEGT